MAFHPSNITRRNFVQRAGLLVTALGISGSVQSGLMDQIVKKANKKWPHNPHREANMSAGCKAP